MTDLDKLSAGIEEGDGVAVAYLCRDIYKDAHVAGVNWPAYEANRAYKGSLDAAKSLHDALLPDWRPRIELGGFDAFNKARPADVWTVVLWHKDPFSWHSLEGPCGRADNPARAWLLAILKAYREVTK